PARTVSGSEGFESLADRGDALARITRERQRGVTARDAVAQLALEDPGEQDVRRSAGEVVPGDLLVAVLDEAVVGLAQELALRTEVDELTLGAFGPLGGDVVGRQQ